MDSDFAAVADTSADIAAAQTEIVREAVGHTLQPVTTAAQHTAESASAGLNQARDAASHTAAKTVETMMKTAEDMLAFGQGNVEAFLKSGQILATGVQDLSKHIATAAQASLDETMTSFKAFGGVRSLKDAFDLQAQFARTSVEKMVAETTRLTDASFKLAEQAWAPITARVTLATETITKSV